MSDNIDPSLKIKADLKINANFQGNSDTYIDLYWGIMILYTYSKISQRCLQKRWLSG